MCVAALAVRAIPPKLSPLTVTGVPPVSGVFWPPDDATGESNDIGAAITVPVRAATVTTHNSGIRGALEFPVAHASEVMDVQEDVAHSAAVTDTEAVSNALPKLRPVTVTITPPV